MFFDESITFGEQETNEVALAAHPVCAVSIIENRFLDRLRTGDADAFDEFVTDYSPSVYSLLFRLTENAEEARDLTQETFLRAFRSLGNFRGDADLKTWLYRIAVNESRNRFRWWHRRKSSQTVSLDAPSNGGESTIGAKISDPGLDPEAETLRREREFALRKALSELSRKFREVIVLRDIEGLSYEEAAAALGTNVGTIKSRIARGRDELRKKLSGL